MLLHGRGTDEHDLFPLHRHARPRGAARRRHAPRTAVASAGGRHWYIVRQVGYPDPETFFPTYEALSGWVDGLPEALGAPPGANRARRLLAGRGDVATRSRSARAARRRRPLIALSGFIPEVEGFELDLEWRKRACPSRSVTAPSTRSSPSSSAARPGERLEEAGLDVIYRESPMAHCVDPAFLEELRPGSPQRSKLRSRSCYPSSSSRFPGRRRSLTTSSGADDCAIWISVPCDFEGRRNASFQCGLARLTSTSS